MSGGQKERRISAGSTSQKREAPQRGSKWIAPRTRLRYQWCPIEDGAFLVCRGGRQWILVLRRGSRFWVYIIDNDDQSVERVKAYAEMEEAQEIGESVAKERFGIDGLGWVNRPWRSLEPKSDQVALMHLNGRVPWEGMTRGDAADEIGFASISKIMRAYYADRFGE